MSKKKVKLSKEAVERLSENPFIFSVNRESIQYTNEFYTVFSNKLEEGINAVEAFAQMGINLADVGENRIYGMRNRILEKKEKGLPLYDRRRIGVVPLDKMGKMTQEQELDYWKNRARFFEAVVDIQKKMDDLLEEQNSSSKRN